MSENSIPTQKRSSWLQRSIARITGKPSNLKDLIALLQYASAHDLIDNDTLHMLEGVLNVQELRVRDAMLPRSQMITISNTMPITEIITTIVHSGYSRFPVIGDSKDEILGILLAKDLLPYANSMNNERFHLRDILRPAIFIPESKRLDTLLQDFQGKYHHMAIVVDEYGGVTGLITIEDVLEQIVGNIEDEHDTPDSPLIKKHGNHIYSVKALTTIEEFNTFFSVTFQDDGVETIGGLVIKKFGHLPKRGEAIQIEAFNFKILKADNRRIHWLQVITQPNSAKEPTI
jgi:magnesium and cobalt transporter